MAFNPRKLLNESAVSEATAWFCEPFCAPTTNPPVICPPKCVDLCISTCIDVKPLFPPPPEFFGGHSSPDHSSRLPLFLVIALAILVTCFFLFSCYTIYKFFNLNWYSFRRRRRDPRRSLEEEDLGPNDFLDAEQGPVVDHYLWYIRTVGLDPSAINKIAIVKYKKGDGLVEGTDCAVCLSDFEEDETLRLLPKCSHAFHIPCIDTWLSSHTNCPVCRAGIVNNTAVIPSEEPVVQNSGLAEGTSRAGAPESSRGVGLGSEDQGSELRIRIGDENELRDVIGSKLDDAYDASGGLVEIQPRRRSVSMDSVSASMISDAISITFPAQSNRDSEQESVGTKESDTGMVGRREGSNQRLFTGSSSITRSISCSARLFLSRYACGSRDSAIQR